MQTLGPDQAFGYDVACSLEGTVATTSLANAVKEANWFFCVNVMHGYTHEYLCRLVKHPLVVDGMGLEDLKTMERLFSQSNVLAAGTRFMGACRRRVFINLFLRQWDADKYQNLGNFLLNNYRQALDIIRNNELDVAHYLRQYNLTTADLEGFIAAKRLYVQGLGKEPAHDAIAAEYVSLLMDFRNTE